MLQGSGRRAIINPQIVEGHSSREQAAATAIYGQEKTRPTLSWCELDYAARAIAPVRWHEEEAGLTRGGGRAYPEVVHGSEKIPDKLLGLFLFFAFAAFRLLRALEYVIPAYEANNITS